MKRTRENERLEAELRAILSPKYPKMTVEVAHSDRWDRVCITFRWSGFAGLLPEERFQRLASAIPEDFRHSRLNGFVWLELAPGESVDAYLELPRSEDLADQEPTVYRELVEADFFKFLGAKMGPRPDNACRGDFHDTGVVLSARGFSDRGICEAKLLFIRHGAYCDCQVLQVVQPVLAKLYAGAPSST